MNNLSYWELFGLFLIGTLIAKVVWSLLVYTVKSIKK